MSESLPTKRASSSPSHSRTADQPPTADKRPSDENMSRMVPTLRVLFRGESGIVDEPERMMEQAQLMWILGRNSTDPFGLAGDLQVSRRHARLRRAGSQLYLRDGVDDGGSLHGTFLNGRRLSQEETLLSDGDIIRIGDTFLIMAYWPANFDKQDSIPAIIGQSLAVCRLRHRVLTAAENADVDCILLLGESGTGKELVTKQIHSHSDRAQGPLVVADLGKAPGSLENFVSELFGHTRGAFTGATSDRVGRFEEAEGGTIMLDEIGELSLELQTALLRVLDTKHIQPLGAKSKLKPVNVRVVAATNRDLALSVEENRFRNDLYGRMLECILHLPPLRTRREDILLFVREGLGARSASKLDPELVSRLLLYPWPRNVREALKTGQALAQAAQERGATCITVEMAPSWIAGFTAPPEAGDAGGRLNAAGVEARAEPIAEDRHADTEVTKVKLVAALSDARGNISRAARQLGVNRKSIYRWMEKYGIPSDDIRSRSRS